MPGIPIVILSAADSESLAVHLIREGAEDYLVKNACNADVLMRALRHGLVRYKSRVPGGIAEGTSRQARVVGVVGSKGGVGATTIACSLSAELARQTNQKVLLMDLDMAGGMVPFLLSLEPKFSLLDLIRKVERIDRDCWQAVVVRGPEGLDVISLPGLEANDQITPEDVGHVLSLARPGYDWVVLDLGRLSSFSMKLLDRTSEVSIITTTAIASLYEAKRAVDRALESRIEAERLYLIVNHAGEPKSLTGSDLKKIFGIEVYARLPFDGSELHQACVERTLPAETSQFGKEMVSLARRLAGLPEKRGQGVSPLVSFAGRFRRTGAHQ